MIIEMVQVQCRI